MAKRKRVQNPEDIPYESPEYKRIMKAVEELRELLRV